MRPNLDTLQTEIERYLEELGVAVYYAYSRAADSMPTVYWDCEQHPDYKLFLKAAVSAGAKVIVLHRREFSSEDVDDALDQLASCELPREESREYEHRLNAVRIHDGSVCEIELSFDLQGRVYLFDLRTEWFDEYSEVLDEIRLLSAESDEDEPPMSGFFSRN